MRQPLLKWMLTCAVVLLVGALVQADPAQELATVEQLKSEAFKALRSGEFGRTNELLNRAAELSGDTVLAKMSQWLGSFEQQRQTFAQERRAEYEKAVKEVELLLENNHRSYAIDAATKAYLLAEDKDAFRNLQWVDDLIKESAEMARQCEANEQWLRATRLYADLSSIEPNNPLWKEKLKLATRRIRLLAQYTPDTLKALQEAEVAERRPVDELLNPGANRPATRPAEEANDAFRIDWREMLRDISMDMLWDALIDARANYWRDVKLRDLMHGGLRGLHTLVTTKGLEETFPTLADEGRKTQFLAALDDAMKRVKQSNNVNEQQIAREVLRDLKQINDRTIKLQEPVLVSEFADGAFAELDPFSSMIWPYDVEEFNKSTQGEFSGVGIQIQSEDGELKVVSPLEESPAYEAGIRAGDVITHINGRNAKGITLNQAVRNITGPPGTTVTLTVASPDGKVKDYTIRREVIKVASIKGYMHKPGGGWDYYVDPDNKIAYIRLTNFTKSTTEELDAAIQDMSRTGARAVILDLRFNPGGLLTAATEVSDRFLPGGVIVSTRADRDTPNQPQVISARQQVNEIDLPMVVLVNQFSASASEIVSGALKDQKRALVVGERTFGKGSVQMLFPLNNRTAYLKLTTSHYYLPSGRCIHREENSTEWGVDPDVIVEMTPEQMRAAIDARQELDVLRDANELTPTTQPVDPREALLARDPQLNASLLLLRLQLAGAQL
jgi:carboxyl-terminal processing protease